MSTYVQRLESALGQMREKYEDELATLRARAERAEADLREYRNLCEVLIEGNRCSIKLASDLLIAESTIADLTGQVERLREALEWFADSRNYEEPEAIAAVCKVNKVWAGGIGRARAALRGERLELPPETPEP